MLPKGRPQDLAVEGAFVTTLVEGKKVSTRVALKNGTQKLAETSCAFLSSVFQPLKFLKNML